MALPQPNVLNFTSEMMPFSSTRIWSFITSPQLNRMSILNPQYNESKTRTQVRLQDPSLHQCRSLVVSKPMNHEKRKHMLSDKSSPLA